MKIYFISFLLFFVINNTSYSQVLVQEMVSGICTCFSKASSPENLNNECFENKFEEIMSSYTKNDYSLLVKELEGTSFDLSAIDSTNYVSAYQMGEQMWKEINPLLFERLTFECDPYYVMLDNFRGKEQVLDNIQYDSVYAIKSIPIQNELIENGLGYTQTYSKRGALYLVLGENKKAISDFHKAFELDNENIDPVTFLGFLALESSEYAKAKSFFDQGYNITNSDIFLALKYYAKRKALEN